MSHDPGSPSPEIQAETIAASNGYGAVPIKGGANAITLRRCEQESEALGRLHHPVRLYTEWGKADQAPQWRRRPRRS